MERSVIQQIGAWSWLSVKALARTMHSGSIISLDARKKSDAMRHYSAVTEACHEDWCEFLRTYTHAKVEIAWGRANFNRLTNCLDLSILPLWGPFEGVDVYLEWVARPAG